MKRKTKKTVSIARSRAVTEWTGGDDALTETAAALARAVPAMEPSPTVKARLLARIRAERPAAVAPAKTTVPGWRFESAQAAEGWRESFPGVRFKTLSVDEQRDVVMLMVEMKAGARFPDHPHDEAGDEGLLISGDLVMDGREMGPGDYYHADRGTEHVNIVSPHGCTALLSLRASVWRKWRQTMVAR